jgi:hypothetical protein
MNSKPKSIDMGSLIQKVTKRARELLKKKSKPQNKGKSANGTSRYSKSKRQKLLIGGVRVKLDGGVKEQILNTIGVRTQQRTAGQAHLVELLKLKTIQKIKSTILEYNNKIQDDGSRKTSDNSKFDAAEAEEAEKIEKTLEDVGNNLKLLSDQQNRDFKERQTTIQNSFTENTDLEDLIPIEEEIYNYKLFIDDLSTYEKCNIEKEITALNIFKLFYDLTNMNEDRSIQMFGGFEEGFILELGNEGNGNKIIITKTKEGDAIATRRKLYEVLLAENKKTINTIREGFATAGLVVKNPKRGQATLQADLELSNTPLANKFASPDDFEAKLLGNNAATEQPKQHSDLLLDQQKNELLIEMTGRFEDMKTLIKSTLKYQNAFNLIVNSYSIKIIISDIANKFFEARMRKPEEVPIIKDIKQKILSINNFLQDVELYLNELSATTDITTINPRLSGKSNLEDTSILERDINNIITLYEKHFIITREMTSSKSEYSSLLIKGGNPVKYKSTGQVVHIMFQNKKYKRVIYVKDKRNTKYCKMNNEYILLSKLKVIE